MDAHLPVDAVLFGAAALLALGLLGTHFAERTRVPSLLVSLAIGMAIGSDGLGWVHVGLGDLHWVEDASIAALTLILFRGGLSTSRAALRSTAAPAALMATVGVGITMVTVALVAKPVLGLSLNTALLLGAVVASTDAAAIFSALRRAPIPSRVRSLLEVESGLNDPMAVLLTIGVLESLHRRPTVGEWVIFAVRQMGVGAVAGALVGLVFAAAMQRARFHSSAPAGVAALSAAGVAYGLSATLGGSGLLATYLAGIIIGDRVEHHRAMIGGLAADASRSEVDSQSA